MARAWKPRVPRPPGARALLYPLVFYRLHVSLPRLLGPPREFQLLVAVDMVRAKGLLADGFPEEAEVEGEVIPARITLGASERVARRTALYYTLRRYRPWRAPVIRVVERREVLKPFWLVQAQGRLVAVDAVTGAEEEVG